MKLYGTYYFDPILAQFWPNFLYLALRASIAAPALISMAVSWPFSWKVLKSVQGDPSCVKPYGPSSVYSTTKYGELVILQCFLTATGIIHALSQLKLHAILQHLNQYTFPQQQIHFLQQLTRYTSILCFKKFKVVEYLVYIIMIFQITNISCNQIQEF